MHLVLQILTMMTVCYCGYFEVVFVVNRASEEKKRFLSILLFIYLLHLHDLIFICIISVYFLFCS